LSNLSFFVVYFVRPDFRRHKNTKKVDMQKLYNYLECKSLWLFGQKGQECDFFDMKKQAASRWKSLPSMSLNRTI